MADRVNEGMPTQVGDGCELAPSVRWGRNVRLGNRVRIGDGTVVRDNVTIGDGCSIGCHCVIGEPRAAFYVDRDGYDARPVVVGDDSILRSGSILYEDVVLGPGFQSGTHVCIREKVRIGARCSIGNQGDVQSDVIMGDHTRLHCSVHVAAGTQFGKFVWVMPRVTFTNDNLFPVFSHPEPATVGHYSVIGTNSLVYPGARLGLHVVAAAGSGIKGEHEDYAFIEGNPAKKRCDARKFFVQVEERTVFPYPWPMHVDRDYPWKSEPRDQRHLEDYV